MIRHVSGIVGDVVSHQRADPLPDAAHQPLQASPEKAVVHDQQAPTSLGCRLDRRDRGVHRPEHARDFSGAIDLEAIQRSWIVRDFRDAEVVIEIPDNALERFGHTRAGKLRHHGDIINTSMRQHPAICWPPSSY